MKNRPNTPNLEKCVVLLMAALEYAQRVEFEANMGVVTPPLALPKRKNKSAFGEGAEKSVVVTV